MKKILVVIAAVGMLLSSTASFAQTSPKEKGFELLTDNFLKGQLTFLASDYMEGRATIEKGGRLAATYMASILEMYGIEPAGDMVRGKRTYFQYLPFSKFEGIESNTLKVVTENRTECYQGAVDFFYNPTRSFEFSGELVFAGFGLIDESINHNDFYKADVKNKVVVIYNGFPTDGDLTDYFTKDRAKNYRAALQKGAQYMKENGAVAVLTISSLESFLATATNSATNKNFYGSEAISPIRPRLQSPLSYTQTSATIKISPRIEENIFAGSSVDVKDYLTKSVKGAKTTPKTINGVSVEYAAEVKLSNVTSPNVLGMIKGKDSSKTVVVGGHYDHMGINGNFIWNGADDNASGSIGVIATAAAMATSGETPEYDVIFALWTGEELGLWGSRLFVECAKEYFPNTEIISNINLDMLSRSYADDKLKNEFDYEYSSTNPEYKTYGENNIKKFGLNLKPRYSAMEPGSFSGATDYVPFKSVGIPVIGFFSGFHPDYHKISDELKNLDWEKFFDLVRLSYLNTYDVANQK